MIDRLTKGRKLRTFFLLLWDGKQTVGLEFEATIPRQHPNIAATEGNTLTFVVGFVLRFDGGGGSSRAALLSCEEESIELTAATFRGERIVLCLQCFTRPLTGLFVHSHKKTTILGITWNFGWKKLH